MFIDYKSVFHYFLNIWIILFIKSFSPESKKSLDTPLNSTNVRTHHETSRIKNNDWTKPLKTMTLSSIGLHHEIDINFNRLGKLKKNSGRNGVASKGFGFQLGSRFTPQTWCQNETYGVRNKNLRSILRFRLRRAAFCR